MALSWNEIKDRALKFSKDWEHTTNEEADAKPFLDAFFDVFGISRRKIGSFEHRVKKLNDADGYIDLLWKGTILIEMKSLGKNLDKAFVQAKEYTQGLPAHELPKYILLSDFANFRLFDTEEQTTHSFTLNNFVQHVNLFGFISGYQKKVYKEQDPANIKAAELMGKLHDRLEEIGYTGHPLEVYLVRILFCLFAEDTTIFEKQQFQDYIEQRTAEDGSDLAAKLQELFQVLNTPNENRFKNLDEQLADFPYVNGKLFEENLPTASFDTKMRQALLNCCYIDWSQISPAIFGSMFQSVMNPKERRNLGAHYTSEKNILKVIRPLFIDELWAEYEKIKKDKSKLKKLQDKISRLRFLDPACGCGNFLIIAYRELRLLELEIVKGILDNQQITSINDYFLVDVDKFYGIEYEEFPAQIAQVAMWLIDHQMNMKAGEVFGEYYVRLPLRKRANIVHGNALRIDWQSLLQPQLHDLWNKEDIDNLRYDYIMGNPPFIGERQQSGENRQDLELIFGEKVKLDYVAAWYFIAKKFVTRGNTKVAFVSTNSISQGEQVALLWSKILDENTEIFFAHRTFKWSNEAKGNAAVFCIIIGLARKSNIEKSIFEYEDIKGEAHRVIAKNINPYLIDGRNIFIEKKGKPICSALIMRNGSRANDRGLLLFNKDEKEMFIQKEPKAEIFFRKVMGAYEFINNIPRYALWLENIEPSTLKSMQTVLEIISKVKVFRPETPHLFESIRKATKSYLFIPQMSSANRDYLPTGYLDKEIIPLDPHFFIDGASIFHFGVLTSKMHNIWIRYVCGRLKSDLRYSNSIVYNNFSWPENPSEKTIEEKAQNVLDARLQFPNSSLADLYDPLTMPPALVKAHNALDKAVDLAYRPQAFTSEAKRMEFLFELYEKYTADLFTTTKSKKGTKKK
jgi:type I restriction-modification system DNA methylase subunit